MHKSRFLGVLKSDCAYTLFFVTDHPGIDNIPQIERFQEKAYMELQDYVTRTYPEDSYRFVGFTSVLHNAGNAGNAP